MPVIALAGAAASFMTGMAALEAGSAIVGGLMMAGGVASALGTVTGNKTLSQLGMVASLAGGLGGLASGAWDTAAQSISANAADTATATGSELAREASRMAEGATQAVSGVSPMGLAEATAASPGALGLPDGGLGYAANGGASAVASGAPPPRIVAANTPDLGTGYPSDGGATALATGAPSSDPLAASGSANYALSDPTAVPPAGGTPSSDPMASQAAAGSEAEREASRMASAKVQAGAEPGLVDKYFKPIGQFINKNAGVAQLGAGLVSGAVGAFSQDSLMKKKYVLQQQYEANLRQLTSDSVRGLTAPTYSRT